MSQEQIPSENGLHSQSQPTSSYEDGYLGTQLPAPIIYPIPEINQTPTNTTSATTTSSSQNIQHATITIPPDQQMPAYTITIPPGMPYIIVPGKKVKIHHLKPGKAKKVRPHPNARLILAIVSLLSIFITFLFAMSMQSTSGASAAFVMVLLFTAAIIFLNWVFSRTSPPR